MSLSHRIFAFILPLFITSFLSAQVSVSGVVTNDKGDALSGANVYLAGTSLGAAAKSDGKYQIDDVPAGNYTLVFSYLGYSTMETSVQVGNRNATQNAQLSRAALEIEALQVTGTIIKDRVTPFPHSSLTSEDLELRTASRDITAVMADAPGVYFTESKGGAGDSRVYIRGFDQENSATLILSLIHI